MIRKAKSRRHHLAIVWEFRILPGKKRAFEKVYGPQGDWAQLFRRAKGFVRTELLRDRNTRGQYLTIDYWQSRQAFAAFKKKKSADYDALDQKCARLTQSESKLGEFQR
jgi:heme-degrading monooxygenase HmoA